MPCIQISNVQGWSGTFEHQDLRPVKNVTSKNWTCGTVNWRHSKTRPFRNQTFFQHWKAGPFRNQTSSQHSKTGLSIILRKVNLCSPMQLTNKFISNFIWTLYLFELKFVGKCYLLANLLTDKYKYFLWIWNRVGP